MKVKTIFPILISLPVLFSCSREGVRPEGSEILLALGDFDMTVQAEPGTKATPVTSLASTTLYWGATMGGNAAGSADETVKYETEDAVTSSGAVIATGKYQTATPTAYNWYISNVPFTTSENTSLTVPDNSTDIVIGRLFGETSSTPTVTIGHIFARLCSVTVQAYSGYTVSSVSVTITPKTSGTYNLCSMSWTEGVDASTETIAESAPGTKSNDIWLVPGEYTLTIGWTETISNYEKTFSGVTKTVTLLPNRTNNLTITLGGDASAIVISTSLTPFTPVDAGLYEM